MSSSYTSLHYHLVFSTKNREPLISTDWLGRLHEYLGGAVKGLGGVSGEVGGVADHVHLLVTLKPTHRLSDFMRELKKASSVWISESMHLSSFGWQEGYAAFTVSASTVASVQNYIANQEAHHQRFSFRDELVELLKRSGVRYNERYLD